MKRPLARLGATALLLLLLLDGCFSATNKKGVAYLQPTTELCSASASEYWESQRKCEQTEFMQPSPWVGKRVAERSRHFRAMCMQSSWVIHNTKLQKYAHMASLAVLPDNRTLMAAWQASKEGEGTITQWLMTAISQSGGHKWTWRRKLLLQRPPYASPKGVKAPDWHQDTPVSTSLDGIAAVSEGRPAWGPALLASPPNFEKDGAGAGGNLWMFYSLTQTCEKDKVLNKTRPGGRWCPGGDILAMESPNGHDWSNPVALLRQSKEAGVPFVTANSPAVNQDGHWLLPFWAEEPRNSNCQWDSEATAAGVLISRDKGSTWTASKPIKAEGTWLIEGTIIPLDGGQLLQMFRSSVGVIYQARSTDGGYTWSAPQPTDLLNPNSKVSAIPLSNGQVALAYNAHSKHGAPPKSRSLLVVAVSSDRGVRWTELAKLEMGFLPGARFHYPSLLQHQCKLVVLYSVGWEEGYEAHKKGAKMMTGIKSIIIHLNIGDTPDGVPAAPIDNGPAT